MKNLSISGRDVRIIDLRPVRDELQINVYISAGHSIAKSVPLHGDTRPFDDIVNDLTIDVDAMLPSVIAEEPSAPNIPGFVAEIKAAMGGIVPLNALMRDYPAFYPALLNGQFDDVRSLVLDASLTLEQYAAFKTAFLNNNIPVVLP